MRLHEIHETPLIWSLIEKAFRKDVPVYLSLNGPTLSASSGANGRVVDVKRRWIGKGGFFTSSGSRESDSDTEVLVLTYHGALTRDKTIKIRHFSFGRDADESFTLKNVDGEVHIVAKADGF